MKFKSYQGILYPVTHPVFRKKKYDHRNLEERHAKRVSKISYNFRETLLANNTIFTPEQNNETELQRLHTDDRPEHLPSEELGQLQEESTDGNLDARESPPETVQETGNVSDGVDLSLSSSTDSICDGESLLGEASNRREFEEPPKKKTRRGRKRKSS